MPESRRYTLADCGGCEEPFYVEGWPEQAECAHCGYVCTDGGLRVVEARPDGEPTKEAVDTARKAWAGVAPYPYPGSLRAALKAAYVIDGPSAQSSPEGIASESRPPQGAKDSAGESPIAADAPSGEALSPEEARAVLKWAAHGVPITATVAEAKAAGTGKAKLRAIAAGEGGEG